MSFSKEKTTRQFSKLEILEMYDDYIQIEDEWNDMNNYCAPRYLAEFFTHNVLQWKSLKILDLGCGTGGLGHAFKSHEYLHGVDFHTPSLDIARDTDLYATLSYEDCNNRLTYTENSFDATLSVGAFTHSHFQPEVLREMVRITKDNGYMAFTISETYYNDEFDFELNTLPIKLIDSKKDNYIKEKLAYYFVYRVSKEIYHDTFE